MDHTTRSISLRLTKCQNFRPKNTYMCYHALPEASKCCASLSTCFHVPPWVLMRWHMCTCHALTRAHAPCADMHVSKLWRHPSLYGLTCLFNLDRLENLTQSELPAPNKKKKKERKKKFWLSWTLTLTKKSKLSKGACPTQFFTYIPILGSVSLFDSQNLSKLSNFQKVDFCTNID